MISDLIQWVINNAMNVAAIDFHVQRMNTKTIEISKMEITHLDTVYPSGVYITNVNFEDGYKKKQ
jgi:hypothetical protein